MVENSLLDVSTWIRRLGPDFKDSIAPYGLSCVFLYYQIRVDKPLLRAATNYWVPSYHVFHFNRVELCPTFEEFSTIMGGPNIDNFVFLILHSPRLQVCISAASEFNYLKPAALRIVKGRCV